MAKVRLDKFISSTLILTRKEAHTLIKRGRVTVDGKIVKDIAFKTDTEKSFVEYNGQTLSYTEFHYYMMNKPAGYITSTEDSREPTVMELLPEHLLKLDLFPVGRLDKDTEGLLLLTDNGELAHRMLSPKHHVDKTYYVESDLPLADEDRELFERGVDIGEKNITLPAKLEIDSSNPQKAHITICEGKFHQIKRMFNAVGKNVVYLERVSFGPLTLCDDLPRGQTRALYVSEIEKIEKI